MRALYYEGAVGPAGRVFTGVLLGLKADLKWHTKVGRLIRSYEHQGTKRNIECCHHCLAGGDTLPWEDLGQDPCWKSTIFARRPWSLTSPPELAVVPFDQTSPEAFYRTDPFHTGKVGVLRDMCGSSIFW